MDRETTSDHPTETNDRPLVSSVSLQVGRAFLLSSLIYGTWRLGVDGLAGQWYLSVALTVTTLLAAFQLIQRTPTRLTKPAVLAIAVCWIAYAYLQTIPLPESVIATIAPGTDSIRGELIDNHLGTLATNGALVAKPTTTLSTVPGLTRREASRYTLGLAALFCAMVLFNTARSRRILAWALLLNAVALACWGIVQQATASEHLFPGNPNPVESSYFSTYIYKNAAGAALLSGVTIAAGFIYWIHTYCEVSVFRRRRSKTPDRAARLRRYRQTNFWLDPFQIGICCLLGVLAVALVVSQSRGACAAASLALVVAVVLGRRSIRFSDACVGVGFLAVTAAGFLWLTGLRAAAERTTNRVNVESVTADERWQHWIDGVATAKAHAPFGAGIGAYGYAQLAQQSVDTAYWFREAHNQYLETIAAAGIIGLILMTALLWAVSKICWSLWKHTESVEAKGWGLIGCLLLVGLAFQSFFDFVVVIPANMLLFAAIFGVVLAVYHEIRSAEERTEERQSPATGKPGPAFSGVAFAAVILMMLGGTMLSYRKELNSNHALSVTKLPADDDRASLAQIDEQIALLDLAVENDPLCAALYQRRAVWHQLQLRQDLIRYYAATEAEVTWAQTNRETIFALFSSQQEDARTRLRAELTADASIRQSLTLAASDIARSLSLNPFVPQTQMSATLLATWFGDQSPTWAANCRRLSRSSPELLLAGGLMAMYMNDKAMMLQQWNRYFRLTQHKWEFVLDLARKSLTPQEIAGQLIPPSQADLLIRYVEQVHRSEHSIYSIALLKQATKAAHANHVISQPEQNAILARMYLLSSDLDISRDYWLAALEGDRRNLDYRYQYAKSLLRCKQYDAARKQAVLGKTLDHQSRRFKLLAEKIDAEQARSRQRASRRAASRFK